MLWKIIRLHVQLMYMYRLVIYSKFFLLNHFYLLTIFVGGGSYDGGRCFIFGLEGSKQHLHFFPKSHEKRQTITCICFLSNLGNVYTKWWKWHPKPEDRDPFLCKGSTTSHWSQSWLAKAIKRKSALKLLNTFLYGQAVMATSFSCYLIYED